MLMMMPPLLRYFWFHSIYSLAASCSLLSEVCGLQSLVCSLQMSHTEKKTRGFGVLLLGWSFFVKNWGIGVTLSELSAWTST